MNESQTAGGARSEAAIKTMIALGVLAIAFIATFVVNRPGQHVSSFSHTVTAGGFQFHYPSSWGTLPSGALPSSTSPSSTSGDVVAGLCPGARTGCASSKVDVMYVLFDQRAGIGGAADLEQQLDSSLPLRLSGFRKVGAGSRVASDRTPYLRYEFTFNSNGIARREVIGAFRSNGGSGVLVVATGPRSQFGAHAVQIDAMLDGAHDDAVA